jgi:uncharacterized protein YecE (DUF72 family)
MPKCRIGCSGFLYESWRGTFYPEEITPRHWLSFYVQHFNTVELNVTFYRLLKKEAFERWHNETQKNFCFSLKGSRLITHIKKLKDVELPLATFFNTTSPLLEKLEVVLWQLPPNFRANLKGLSDFIQMIKPYPVRHVFEFRHKSWINKKVFKLFSDANIAICLADWPDFNKNIPITANFVYIRKHGEVGSYATNYTTDQLKKDAKAIKEYLKQGKDVYLYYNNDALGYAPKNAKELLEILEKTLPATLKEAITERREEKRKKPKPTKKVSKKVVKKPKKKKPAKKTKTKKTLRKKVKPKKTVKKPSKKMVKKKVVKKRVKKKLKRKITKKTVKKKPAKKTKTAKKKRK